MTNVTTVELTHGNADELRALYDEYEWWADREHADVKQALEHTSLAIGLRDEDELVAAARVFTDFVYYAKVYDVIVAEARRGNGFGERLMRAVTDHPDLDSIDVIELLCRDGLIPFYETCGFAVYDTRVEIDGHEEEFVKMNYDS
jgi:predicted GNAT family N-acyltransferase